MGCLLFPLRLLIKIFFPKSVAHQAITQATALLDEFRFIQKQAGVDSNYGFHALKKSCGTLNAPRMTEAELNKFMRHTSVETTRAYYQNRDEIMRGAAEKVYVPGVARRR